MGKEPAYNAGDMEEDASLIPEQEDPWRRKWHPTLVFLLGKSHGEEPGGLQTRLQPMGLQRVRHD